MNRDPMTATRMPSFGAGLPPRVLIVDDDELELALMAERLTMAGFEVTRAANGEEALSILRESWFPLVITDWQMPVMDGIRFTEELRRGGNADDTYVIMLTLRESSFDYERGYTSGVDDYLTKKLPDAELFARIHGAFNTLALRHSLKETRAALEGSSMLDRDSGAFSFRELRERLHAEIKRAQRYGRQLAVLTVGVHPTADARPEEYEPRQIVEVLRKTVRAHVDWIARLDANDTLAFAIVLPETGVTEGPAVKERVLAALRRETAMSSGGGLRFSFGLTALERGVGNGPAPVESGDMMEVAEHCRQCSGHTGAAQLTAVQRSVTGHVGIACRHGYAVDSRCGFKAQGHADDPFAEAG